MSMIVKRCPHEVNDGELEEKTYRKPYKCDGCKMKGIGKGCRCKECDYVLHKDCMLVRETLKSPIFPDSDFEFYENPPRSPCKKRRRSCSEQHHSIRYCDACGKLVEGFVYHCATTDVDLHPRCAKLEPKFSIADKPPVEFMLKKGQKQKKCGWCKSKVVEGGDKDIRGWFYESENKEYNFHVFCIMDIAMKSCEIAKNNDGDFRLALEKELKDLDSVSNKKRKRGKDGKNMSLEILKSVVSIVLSMVLGDPTQIVAKLLVEGSITLVECLMQLLSN